MKKKILYILAALIAAWPISGSSQTILSVTTDNSRSATINVNVNSGNVPLNNNTSRYEKNPANKSPRTIVWIEYGDGEFTTLPTSSHTYRVAEGSSISPLMVMKATGIYDQGGKPPRSVAKMLSITSTSPAMSRGNLVLDSNDKNVYITPNVFDVVSEDTMIFALSYRKPERWQAAIDDDYYLLFIYNENSNIFNKITANSEYGVTNDRRWAETTISNIRMHNGETIISRNDLPNSIKAAYGNQLNDDNCLAFKLPMHDYAEHHIFVTLIANKFSENDNRSVSMKAVLGGPGDLAQEYNYTSHIALSHDPNWQEVYPKCIVLPKNNQVMKHHIHFQNTGEGPARQVEVRTTLPSGLSWTDIDTAGWAIGGIKWNPRYTMTVSQEGTNVILFKFIYTENENMPMPDRILYGSGDLPDAIVNVKTMGDIYFTCRAKPGVPDIMTSHSSIKFDDNTEVITGTAKVEFKKCCDDPNCRNGRSAFWTCTIYWILILLIVAAICYFLFRFWFFKRRRSKKRQS